MALFNGVTQFRKLEWRWQLACPQRGKYHFSGVYVELKRRALFLESNPYFLFIFGIFSCCCCFFVSFCFIFPCYFIFIKTFLGWAGGSVFFDVQEVFVFSLHPAEIKSKSSSVIGRQERAGFCMLFGYATCWISILVYSYIE